VVDSSWRTKFVERVLRVAPGIHMVSQYAKCFTVPVASLNCPSVPRKGEGSSVLGRCRFTTPRKNHLAREIITDGTSDELVTISLARQTQPLRYRLGDVSRPACNFCDHELLRDSCENLCCRCKAPSPAHDYRGKPPERGISYRSRENAIQRLLGGAEWFELSVSREPSIDGDAIRRNFGPSAVARRLALATSAAREQVGAVQTIFVP